MAFTLALAQCGYPADGDVPGQVLGLGRQAADAGAHLLVFPENLMSPYGISAQGLRELAEPLDGPFLEAMRRVAESCGLWMVGTMSEVDDDGGAPFNTAWVIDDAGELRTTYRKCHLYDAHGVSESSRMGTGDALCHPVRAPFGTIGLGICYDLRFPEAARLAAIEGAQLLLYPSAWHDGPHKPQHWETLLRARAIENELWVAGVCRSGGRYVGRSLVVDPLGEVVARGPEGYDGPEGEALVLACIDTAAVSAARDAMPILDHRRPELYAPLAGSAPA